MTHFMCGCEYDPQTGRIIEFAAGCRSDHAGTPTHPAATQERLERERPPPVLTEGRKDDVGKARFDLIPARPLEALAALYAIGATKYAPRNWEKGLAYGRVFAAMMRHAWAWWRGEKHDPEDGQHHLSSVVWCAFALQQLEETHAELDDRPTALPQARS